jgi:predicted nucleic acid-binding protein
VICGKDTVDSFVIENLLNNLQQSRTRRKLRILLDTNIIVHREEKDPTKEEIGKLFWWIDKLKYDKCIHQVTIEEISLHKNHETRKAFLTKMQSYNQLKTAAPLKEDVTKIAKKYDSNTHDANDTVLINEVASGRVDLLITEDTKIHKKASELGLETKVFSIDSFLEKVTNENPEFVDYKVPSVKQEFFGNISLKDEFFDSFREDYVDFDKWFNRKADEKAYVCLSDNKIIAFLYLRTEGETENYSDITPPFTKMRRLKIGTFKVRLNGLKLGERFLKIVFDNALHLKVGEVYVTLFNDRIEHSRLINLFTEYGFVFHGIKRSFSGEEQVYTRDFSRKASLDSPKTTYPFVSRKASKFIVPIYPEYHTNLFPDSILRTESPMDFVELEPFRNAISKVYVSRSIERNLQVGDIIVFYRTDGYYESVVTTLGIVDGVYTKISDYQQFIELCKKRSVFSDKELKGQWDYKPNNRPFVVNFLYAYSFPKRINLKALIDLGIIKDTQSAPRGFERLSDESFEKIVRETRTDANIIVD